MGFKIKYPGDQFSPGKSTKRKKSDAYLDFIRSLPCIYHHVPGVEAAHLSTAAQGYGHLGSGGARKATDRWALPLCRGLHAQQHGMNETEFWASVKINPYLACLIIHGLWTDYGEDAYDHVVNLIMSNAFQTE